MKELITIEEKTRILENKIKKIEMNKFEQEANLAIYEEIGPDQQARVIKENITKQEKSLSILQGLLKNLNSITYVIPKTVEKK
jgi:hypothetical protein